MRRGSIQLLVLTLALLASACGSGDDARTVTETVTVTTEAVDPDQAEADGTAPVDCSATRLEELPPIDASQAAEIPDEVLTARDDIRLAAANCDFEALGRLADHDEFAYEEGNGDPAAFGDYLRRYDADQQLTARIVQLLSLPVAIVAAAGDDDTDIYAWPSAFAEDATDFDWQVLADSGAYPDAQVDAFRETGGYLGYRIGITGDGTWQYFTAGN